MRSPFIWWLKRKSKSINKLQIIAALYAVSVFVVLIIHIYIYQMGGLAAVTGYFIG